MIVDPFDAALSDFIDNLPHDPEAAGEWLDRALGTGGRGDLPELVGLATMLRAVGPPQPSTDWIAASKARLTNAMRQPAYRSLRSEANRLRAVTLSWLHAAALPRFRFPTLMVARAITAFVLILSLTTVTFPSWWAQHLSILTGHQFGGDPGVQDAQQAIAATEQVVMANFVEQPHESQVADGEIQGEPRDVVLLSKRFAFAQLAIDKAPPAQQPTLRSELGNVVKPVRFQGQLEAVTNGNTMQVSGLAVTADAGMLKSVKVGQPVSLLVTIGDAGKLRAVAVEPAQPGAPNPAATPSSSSQPTSGAEAAASPVTAGNSGGAFTAADLTNASGNPSAGGPAIPSHDTTQNTQAGRSLDTPDAASTAGQRDGGRATASVSNQSQTKTASSAAAVAGGATIASASPATPSTPVAQTSHKSADIHPLALASLGTSNSQLTEGPKAIPNTGGQGPGSVKDAGPAPVTAPPASSSRSNSGSSSNASNPGNSQGSTGNVPAVSPSNAQGGKNAAGDKHEQQHGNGQHKGK